MIGTLLLLMRVFRRQYAHVVFSSSHAPEIKYDVPIKEPGLAKSTPSNEHITVTPETPLKSPTISRLPTPELVFTPATPATTDTSSLPPTPCPVTHVTGDETMIYMSKENRMGKATDGILSAPVHSSQGGLGLQLSAADAYSDNTVPIYTGSDSDLESGNASFHTVHLGDTSVTSSSSSSSSRKNVLKRLGSGLASALRRPRKGSNASDVSNNAPTRTNFEVDLEGGEGLGMKKRKNRMFGIFVRA